METATQLASSPHKRPLSTVAADFRKTELLDFSFIRNPEKNTKYENLAARSRQHVDYWSKLGNEDKLKRLELFATDHLANYERVKRQFSEEYDLKDDLI